MKFKWEKVSSNYNKTEGGSNTYRAKVIGGWVLNVDLYTNPPNIGSRNLATTSVFIPDPNHEWSID